MTALARLLWVQFWVNLVGCPPLSELRFIVGIIGRGCTGTVRLGTHKATSFTVAFKIIKKKHLNSVSQSPRKICFACPTVCNLWLQKPKLWQKVKREIAILKLIEHPHILKLYDVLETDDRLYLVNFALSVGTTRSSRCSARPRLAWPRSHAGAGERQRRRAV